MHPQCDKTKIEDMIDYKKYVFETQDDTHESCGVLVGDLFVTAGHVVAEHPFYAIIEGKKYVFDKKDAILYLWNEEKASDEGSVDVAVFKVEGANSPLTFADYIPSIGDCMRSVSYECKEGECVIEDNINLKNLSENSILKSSTFPYYKINDCKAEVVGVTGNYTICKTDVILKPGSSGSPLICDNKVFGILHGGTNTADECAFLSSKVILDKLNKN